MKFLTSVRSPRRNARRVAWYHPRVEALELRLQPGEAFLTGLAVELALTNSSFAALDARTPALVDEQAFDFIPDPARLDSLDAFAMTRAEAPPAVETYPTDDAAPIIPPLTEGFVSVFPPTPRPAALPLLGITAPDLMALAAAAPVAAAATPLRAEQPPRLTGGTDQPLMEEMESVAGTYSESGELVPDADPPAVRVLSIQTIQVPPGADAVTLNWSTYLGSFLYDTSSDVEVFGDAQYITGATMGLDFITRPVVARFDLDASLVYLATIDFAGAYFSSATALDLDAAGNVYLVGDTDFRFPGETAVGFALRLSADFSTVEWRLTYSGQAGAGNAASLRDVTVNAAGTQVWMAGGLNLVISDRTDRGMLVARHNAATGQQLNGRWHRLSGGYPIPAASEGFGIAVNAQGIVYVAGAFLDFISEQALTQSVCVRLNTDLTMNQYRYFTNNGIDLATSVVLDSGSNPYLTGTFSRPDGSKITNLMLAKFNAALTSTTYGFSYRNVNDASLVGNAIALNALNQPILLGTILEEADSDLLLYRMSTANPPQFLDGARVGGSNYELAGGVATGPAGAVYVTGLTISTDYPTTPGVVQENPSFLGDGVLTKLTVA